MKKTLILLFALLVGFLGSVAQKSGKPLRVEIQASHFSDKFNIVPVGENGVVLFSLSDEKTKEKDIWIFTKYNTQFKEEWSQKFPIEYGYNFEDFFYSNDILYVFFNSDYKGESHLDIVKVDLKSNIIEDVNVSFKPKTKIEFFKVLGNHACVAGNTSPTMLESCSQYMLTCTCLPFLTGMSTYKIKPVVVNIDMSSKKKKIIIPALKGNSKVISANVNEEANVMNVVVNSYNISGLFKNVENYTLINEYNNNGELNSSIKLKSNPTKDLVDGKIMQVNESDKIFIGTYNKTVDGRKNLSTYADGMCFSRIVDNKQEFMKYYEFTEFDNFYASVSARFRKKVERKKKKGKDISVGFLLLVHDKIIVKNDEYIMVAEAYYPEYHTETHYDPGTRQYTTRQVFDGYRYTHAIVAAFDKDGERLWDNTFEIMNILTFNLKERVKVLRNNETDEVVLVYSYAGQLHSKVIEGSKVVERKQTTKIEAKNKNDKVKADYDSDMEYWYDNYFITWGYQRIKDKGKGIGNKRRQVFYFTKIAYN